MRGANENGHERVLAADQQHRRSGEYDRLTPNFYEFLQNDALPRQKTPAPSGLHEYFSFLTV